MALSMAGASAAAATRCLSCAKLVEAGSVPGSYTSALDMRSIQAELLQGSVPMLCRGREHPLSSAGSVPSAHIQAKLVSGVKNVCSGPAALRDAESASFYHGSLPPLQWGSSFFGTPLAPVISGGSRKRGGACTCSCVYGKGSLPSLAEGLRGTTGLAPETSWGNSLQKLGAIKVPQSSRAEAGRGSSWGGKGPKAGGKKGSGSSGSRSRVQSRTRGGRSGGYKSRREDVGEKALPAGAFEMVDPETGERVVVWGPDEGADWVNPTLEDIRFEPLKVVTSGNISEDQWWRIMEGDKYMPSGGYGARGEAVTGEADDFDDDFELDDGESGRRFAELDDEEEHEERDWAEGEEEGEEAEDDAEEAAAGPSAPRRTRKVMLFGRDFKGRRAAAALSAAPTNGRVQGSEEPSTTAESASTGAAVGEGSGLLQKGGGAQGRPRGGAVGGVRGGLDMPQTLRVAAGGKKGEAKGQREEEEEEEEEDEEEEEMRRAKGADEREEGNQGEEVARHRVVLSLGSGERREVVVVRAEGRGRDVVAEEEEEEEEEEREEERDESERQAAMESAGRRISGEASESSHGRPSRTERSREAEDSEGDLEGEAMARAMGRRAGVPEGFEGIVDMDAAGSERPRSKQEEPESGAALGSGFMDALRRKALGLEGTANGKAGTSARANQEPGGGREGDAAGVGGGEAEGRRPAGKVGLAGEGRANFDERLVDEFLSGKSFAQVGAAEDTGRALASMGIRRPSHIQAMTFKPVLNGRDVIMADQTGTGKTLAYLAPIAQRLKKAEAEGDGRASSRRPRALILVPTTELAAQVLHVCRQLSEGGLRLRSQAVTGGFPMRTQVEALRAGVDIVVATPGRLLQHLEARTVVLDHVKSVVVDEADILFDDESFAETLRPIRAEVPAGATQFVHVTATLPTDVHDALLEEYPGAVSLMGPSLHLVATGLQEILVDCSGGEERTPEAAFVRKREALLQLVEQRPASKTIVFCNTIDTCRKVENVLSRHDRSGQRYEVLAYHAALAQDRRQATMQRFLQPQPRKRLFLVCTDRASRGMDSLDVEQVVLFDFPRDPSEYVRRVGRTARGAGGTGSVYVFALGKQVPLARRIMARNDKGQPVHSIPGSRY